MVVLARAGQDLSQYQLRYSHLGWAYKTAEGPWRVLHKLNTCGAATGALYRQGLGEFFLDDLWRYGAGWAVPLPALPARFSAGRARGRRIVCMLCVRQGGDPTGGGDLEGAGLLP